MVITVTQQFAYVLLVMTFVTISVLVLLNVYSVEIFLVVIILEFLVLVELMAPSFVNVFWQKIVTLFVVICVIVFSIILYLRVVPTLS
jgi:hypothetical protein